MLNVGFLMTQLIEAIQVSEQPLPKMWSVSKLFNSLFFKLVMYAHKRFITVMKMTPILFIRDLQLEMVIYKHWDEVLFKSVLREPTLNTGSKRKAFLQWCRAGTRPFPVWIC